MIETDLKITELSFVSSGLWCCNLVSDACICEPALQRQTSAGSSNSDAAFGEMNRKITTARKSTSKTPQTKSTTPDDHKSSQC